MWIALAILLLGIIGAATDDSSDDPPAGAAAAAPSPLRTPSPTADHDGDGYACEG